MAASLSREGGPEKLSGMAAARRASLSPPDGGDVHASFSTRAVRHSARRLFPECRVLESAAARGAGGRAGRRRRARASRGSSKALSSPQQYERARKAAAALIGADPADVALISSVGYGVATAGKVLAIPRGSRVLVLQNDHTSPVLEWMSRAEAGGYTVETVKQPSDGDWTSAVLEAIERPGAAPLALVSISSVHWSDGGALDMPRIAKAAKKKGAALLVDATHDAGVRRIDVKTLDPDFLIFPTYKWVLGPYGRAFMYVAKRRQNGVPLEQTAASRKAVSAEDTVYFRDISYRRRRPALRHGRARPFHLASRWRRSAWR